MYAIRPARGSAHLLRMPPMSAPEPEGRDSLHYFDHKLEREAVKVLPGEYHVTARDLLLVTVLGSCVSACIRDSELGIGGMNHFMLPETRLQTPACDAARYGVFAMEVLINELMKKGARRSALEAKIFGGANVLEGFSGLSVGEQNIRFVKDFLEREQIPVVASDLGDVCPRKVYYFPKSGRVLVKRLPRLSTSDVVRDEIHYRDRMKDPVPVGTVELFE